MAVYDMRPATRHGTRGTAGATRILVDGTSYTYAEVAARLGIAVDKPLYRRIKRARAHPPVTWAALERTP